MNLLQMCACVCVCVCVCMCVCVCVCVCVCCDTCFCDTCLTNLEIEVAETENRKTCNLEKRVTNMESKLREIADLLRKSQNQHLTNTDVSTRSVWDDKEKLPKVKAPPSLLIIRNVDDVERNNQNQMQVENAIMNNNISVSRSYKNKTGDLVVVCESKDIRDELKTVIASMNQEIPMNSLAEKRPSITIVGLPKDYKKEEVIQMLVMQNGYIKKFASCNDIYDHFKIFSIRPLKNNPERYQIFASVSQLLREGFSKFHNKVTLGLNSCKVYDRYHVKRCNNCQHFGHFVKDCPTPDEQV